MTPSESRRVPAPQPSGKITRSHASKLAIVYVRQSTPQQITENRESLTRQYALASHAVCLGWPTDRVLVIDDDLGLSGRTAEGRPGFQRLLAEVTMDHVGLILGLEMSRLARCHAAVEGRVEFQHTVVAVVSDVEIAAGIGGKTGSGSASKVETGPGCAKGMREVIRLADHEVRRSAAG